MTLNVETSKQPPQIDIGTIEIPEQKNLMGTITQSDLPKRQRKQIALKKHRFPMDLGNKQKYKTY